MATIVQGHVQTMKSMMIMILLRHHQQQRRLRRLQRQLKIAKLRIPNLILILIQMTHHLHPMNQAMKRDDLSSEQKRLMETKR